jgi:sugar lactone lactonase YvrE
MKSKRIFAMAGRFVGVAFVMGLIAPLSPSVRAQQPGAAPSPQGFHEVTVTEIPSVIAGGLKWKQVWQVGGNNADGIVGTSDEGLLLAQEDLNQVTKLDRNDYATVFLSHTNGVGSVSIDHKGRVMGVERMVPRTVAYLAPEHKVLADTFDGKPLSDLGRLNDLIADKKGGAYFTVGGAYYAGPSGKVTRIDDNLRTNGIALSRDEKILYVTNGPEVVAFDVQPDGSVKNQRHFAKLEAGGNGDGSTIDSAGRLYVSSAPGVQVFSPAGMYLGVIPTPWPIISVAFSGPGKKMLYIVANGARNGNGDEIHEGPQKIGRTIYKIPMLAEGFKGRAK